MVRFNFGAPTLRRCASGDLLVITEASVANLFGVRFMPCTNNDEIATGAMDGSVQVHSVSVNSTLLTWSCHRGDVRLGWVGVDSY